MSLNAGMFSSATDLWATPQWLFDRLNAAYKFDLDVCATPENAKCRSYYTEIDNGLEQFWAGRCWLNSPYGREIPKWMKKGFYSVYFGDADLVVALPPARTDTKWWKNFIKPIYYGERTGEVYFISGRLKFGDAKNSAPFPSALVLWRKPEIVVPSLREVMESPQAANDNKEACGPGCGSARECMCWKAA